VYGLQINQLATSIQRYRNKKALLTQLAAITDSEVHKQDMAENCSNYHFHMRRRCFEICAMAELLAKVDPNNRSESKNQNKRVQLERYMDSVFSADQYIC